MQLERNQGAALAALSGIPKVDMHRHLGGSIPARFVWDAVREQGLGHLAESYRDVEEAMTFAPGEPYGFHRFLDKFKILDGIRWTEDLIDRSIAAVSRDLVQQGVDYCWMRFSINKYMDSGVPWSMYQAVNFIVNSFGVHAPGRVGLLLSLKYESPRASQRHYAELIDDPSVAESLLGLDLVGDEQYYDEDFYRPIFRSWKSAGKVLCGHVAESGTAENAASAISALGVTHVAHGFRIFDRPEFMRRALDLDVCFDMALTSNYMTGTWTNPEFHPIRRMTEFGLDCTVGTDDPVQCSVNSGQLTMEQEFGLLTGALGFSVERARAVALTAVRRTRALGIKI